MQSMTKAELLELVLQQVFQRVYSAGLVMESFGVQQEIHEELSACLEEMPSLSPSAARNIQKLLSRMSWFRMMLFLKTNQTCDHRFLDHLHRRMASLRKGDQREMKFAESFWL